MMMRQSTEDVVTLSLIICLLGLLSGAVHADTEIEITGIISEDGQLFGEDGVIYVIADSVIGFDLMKLTGHRVNVTGQVMTTDEIVILIVETFEIFPKWHKGGDCLHCIDGIC